MYDVSPLRAKKVHSGSGLIVDIRGHEARWYQNIQFASVTSCEAEWLELGGISGFGGGPEVVVVAPFVLHDLKLFFEMEACCTKDIVAATPKVQKK